MNYFSEDHILFRQSVQQFVSKEVTPFASIWEKEEQIPRDIWRRMGSLGFLGINFPEKYGGSDVDFFYTVAYLEELSRSTLAGFTTSISVHQYMALHHILSAGSEALKEKYLTAAIEGKLIGALGISEPGAGSDVSNIRTTAKKEDGHYIINGSKTFITNGEYCDFITLACKTDPSLGLNGISLIVVDKSLPGVTSKKLKKLGLHCSDTAEIFFDEVKVPVSQLIGVENRGFYYIMESFQLERLVAAVASVAGAEYAIELTLQYMHEREAFGKPISKYQVLRHQMVDMITEVEVTKQFVYHACKLFDQKEFAVKECSMAKLKSSELSKQVADVCLQCFGGYGYMEDYPIARMYRDARAGTIAGGTSEILRDIIAKIVIDKVQYNSAYSEKNTSPTVTSVNELVPSKTKEPNSNYMDKKPESAREIIYSLPSRLKKDEVDENDSSTFHFELSGEDGGQYTIILDQGQVAVEEGFSGKAECLVRASTSVYEDIELGRINAQMAFMMGKIRVSNIGAMLKFIDMFHRLY